MLLDGHTVASVCHHWGLSSPTLLYRRKQDGVPQGGVMALGLEARMGDITYIPLGTRTRENRFGYLALLMHLYSRRIVVWSYQDSMGKIWCSRRCGEPFMIASQAVG